MYPPTPQRGFRGRLYYVSFYTHVVKLPRAGFELLKLTICPSRYCHRGCARGVKTSGDGVYVRASIAYVKSFYFASA
jgi:hypothetical protein